MRVGIIGAGVAGLTTAKVLKQAGHEVAVYDKAPDVGGVWSSSRRYPGLTTQSPKAQYSLSDFPMPRDYPEWPAGPQVQAYLAAYAGHFGLEPALRLSTDVTAAAPAPDGGWAVTAGAVTERFDRLVVANGIFCEPAVPRYPGEAGFTAAGGRVLAGTELHDAEQARGKRVLVVGYGKSACDVTVPVSQVAASTDVIARHLLWKVPRRVGGVLNFKMLLLTRMGEALFRYLRPRGVEKFLHGPTSSSARPASPRACRSCPATSAGGCSTSAATSCSTGRSAPWTCPHCTSTGIIPFSLHNVDEVLGDLGVNISAAVRAWHWLMPVDPAAYQRIIPAVLRRLPPAAVARAASLATATGTAAGPDAPEAISRRTAAPAPGG